ncbi:HNH endonuclease [Arthrobacter sp. NPDC092385]|uniref:HNH endonuclease n=1 Tax=Arthrobacter sp. NPDC092385 TaxID=3363943 RepID=UPI0038277FA2
MRNLIEEVTALRPCAESAGLINQLRELEDLKSAVAGAQARVAVAFDQAERRLQADADVPVAKQGQGVAAQVALARRESPSRGSRLLGLAKALVTEMPRTLAALETGQLNEWRAMLLVRETACLSAADRCAVDEELSADTGAFEGAGDQAIVAAARTASYRRDPRSVTDRSRRAAAERHVSLRPAPDTMTYLTALLPVAEGVAAYASLSRHADSCRSDGDDRSRGQIMADALVERVTGTPGGISGVEIQLIMTDRTLFQGDTEPARLAGYGVVPGGWARSLLAAHPRRPVADSTESLDLQHRKNFATWIRRLYTAPGSGDLVAVDSRSRLFTAGQRRFLEARDDCCRTPYCDAPIRHYDHIVPWRDDGPTSLPNGAGLCEACNHTKELRGWKARPYPAVRHAIELRTPTGHTYRSTAPPPPGTGVVEPHDASRRRHRHFRRQQLKALRRAHRADSLVA